MSVVKDLIKKVEEEIDTFRVHEKDGETHHNAEYQLDVGNLAVPEIHTGKVHPEAPAEETEGIHYDSVAVPEIHVKKTE